MQCNNLVTPLYIQTQLQQTNGISRHTHFSIIFVGKVVQILVTVVEGQTG